MEYRSGCIGSDYARRDSLRSNLTRDLHDQTASRRLDTVHRSWNGILDAMGSRGIDGLWLNAGSATTAPLAEVDAESFDALMATNVRGPFLQLAALAARLNTSASVLVTSSTSAYEAAPTTAV